MEMPTSELVGIVLQYLNENGFHETARELERESGLFFNAKYFEEKVIAGEWEEVERYLLGFIRPEDSSSSFTIFFEIRKLKYLEALDRKEITKAAEILRNDLKVFSSYNEVIYLELCRLFSMENFRDNPSLSGYTDTLTARRITLTNLKQLLEKNAIFNEKVGFPKFGFRRLEPIINDSLNIQHHLCENKRKDPKIKTLFTDHVCEPVNEVVASTSALVSSSAVANGNGYPSLGVDKSIQTAGAFSWPNALAAWSSFLHQSAVTTGISFPISPNQGRARTLLEEEATLASQQTVTRIDELPAPKSIGCDHDGTTITSSMDVARVPS